jgi:polyisoprenoid-binding protein YceI
MAIFPAPQAPGLPTTLLPEGVWTVDPARSRLGFEVRHLRFARVRGRFHAFACRIDVGPRLRITGAVDVSSLDTGDPVRDQHLLVPAFLDAADHPQLRYEADGAEQERDGWRIAGRLTIRDATRPLTLRATPAPQPDDAVRIAARGEIRRRDFGLQWDGLLEAGQMVVSDRVTFTLDVLAVRG